MDRQRFEAWAKHEGFSVTRCKGIIQSYFHADTACAWIGWLAAQPQWQDISTAPKDREIVLWVPAFDSNLAGPWRGVWSYSSEMWALRTPFSAGTKIVMATEIPVPTHWTEIPAPPKEG